MKKIKRANVWVARNGPADLERLLNDWLDTHQKLGHVVESVQVLGPYRSESFGGHAVEHHHTYTVVILSSTEE